LSLRGSRWLIFGVAFATLPLPYFLPEGENAPALRLFFLTWLMSAIYIAEGPGPLAAVWGMALFQLVFWTTLLYLGAALVARLLATLSPWLRGILAISLAAVLIFLSLSEIYWTPLSSSQSRSSLIQIFE